MRARGDTVYGLLFLLGSARKKDGEGAETVDEGDQTNAGRHSRNFLNQDAKIERPSACPSELLGITDGHEALLDEGLVNIPRILIRLVDLRRPRRQSRLRELAHGLSKKFLLLAERESPDHNDDSTRRGGAKRAPYFPDSGDPLEVWNIHCHFWAQRLQS